MSSYRYFLTGSPILTRSPKEYFANEFQAFVNASFNQATDAYAIYKETYINSGSYESIDVRVNHAIDSETGIKLGDDFKVIIFQSPSEGIDLGSKLYFDDNYWLVTYTDNIKGLTSSVTARRCNNTLRWRTTTGSYISEHCVIDYRIATPDNKNRTDPLIPEGTINVLCQLNTETRLIKENQRFLFGNTNLWQCYRVYGGGVNNFMNNETDDNTSAQLLSLAMGKDFVNEDTDELTLGIADFYKFDDSGSAIVDNIQILPISGSILQGSTQVFTCYLYSGETQQSDVFTFSVSGSSVVPTDNYVFTAIDDNSFSVQNVEKYLDDELLIQCLSGSNIRIKSIYLRGAW